MKNKILIILFCFFIFTFCYAQDHDLVDLKKVNPDILIDIRYATDNNFTGSKLYMQAKCYLLRSTAEKLNRVQKELEKKGLGLKVFDGYRPASIQKKLWEVFPDKRYVENPDEASDHSRGAAVDVTLVTHEGKELDMGMGFDEFNEKSSQHYFGFAYEILSNRNLLRGIMRKHGFHQGNTEWWHFYDVNWRQYPVLNIDFNEICGLTT